MIDTWEAFQSYQRTAVVLDHVDYEINTLLGGVFTEDGEQKNVRVMLLAGSDLISTMSEPGVWSYADVSKLRKEIKKRFYTFISSSTISLVAMVL
jgi:nicotinamide mononucleotide adenylyltransferase